MIIVKPKTIIGWHRKGFKLYWKRESRRVGRPNIDRDLIRLIRRMQKENPTWTAQRIQGELVIKTSNCQITLCCSPPGFQYSDKSFMADYFTITLRLRIYHIMIEPCVRTARIIMNYVLFNAIS